MNAKNISLPEFSIDDIKGIKSFAEMQQVDPKITKKDYQHAVNAWHIAQKAGEKIGVDPRLLFGQFGVETLFRDRSVLEQYNYGNIKHFDKSGKNVPQYEGQKAYKDNMTGTEDYYLRFNTIDEAIDWYANRYDENSNSRHRLKGEAKTDPLAFSISLNKSGYYEGDPNLNEIQRQHAYMRGIVSQANKWLSGDELTAQQYTEDPYYSDPNVPQYEGQKAYKDNMTGTEDYYLRFNTIDEAIDWYANRYVEAIADSKKEAPKKETAAAKEKKPAEKKSGKRGTKLDPKNNDSLYKSNQVIRNIYGVQISGFMPEKLEQIKDAASQKASKEKAITEKKRKELEQKKAEEDRIRKVNNAWVKNIKDKIAKAKSEGVDTSELENQLDEYIKPKYHIEYAKIDDISKDVDMFPSDAEMQDIEKEAKSEIEKGLVKNPEFLGRSVPAADVGIANPNKDKSTSSLFHGGILAPVAGALLAGSNIASLDTKEQVANAKGKALSEELEDKESKTKNRATTENVDSLTKATKGANAINAVNAAVGLGLGIYGASQINKMQRPSMVSAPQIEAAKIRDTGAQMMTARKGMIEQSANTSREALRRAGRSDLNATITAGETRALNEAAGSIEGMRANINAANVAAENRVREINASTKMQADQFNSQIQASFNQFKSQLGSQNLSTTVQNISANLGGIAQNNYAKALRERDEEIQLKQARLLATKN